MKNKSTFFPSIWLCYWKLMPEKNFCGVFFMSNEHFCSRCPNMYVFSHGDAPGFLSPHSSRFVPGDFLHYLCDVLESLFPFPAMALVFRYFLTSGGAARPWWDQQARGDGLLNSWAGSSVPAPCQGKSGISEGQEERLSLTST